MHFSHLHAKTCPPSTIGPYHPSWQDKHLGDESFFMYFQWLNLVTCFLTDFALLSCFLQAFLTFGEKTASQNTYWAASILPGNKNSWETGTFWSSSNFWTLCLDFQQCLDCYCSFACISPICMEKHAPPKHNWAISTLPDKTNTWEMNHFWCTSNYWTLCIIPCNFWKVIKVSMGISRLLFV